MKVIDELIEHLHELGLLTERDLLALVARGFLEDHEVSTPGDDAAGSTLERDDDREPARHDARQARRARAFRAPPTWLTRAQIARHVASRRHAQGPALEVLLALGSSRGPREEGAALRAIADTDLDALASRLARAYERGAPTLAAVWSALEPWDVVPTGAGPALNAVRSLLQAPSRALHGDGHAWVLGEPAIAWAIQAERAQVQIARAHARLFDDDRVTLTRALARWPAPAAYIALSTLVTARCAAGRWPGEAVDRLHPVWLERARRGGARAGTLRALSMLAPPEARALAYSVRDELVRSAVPGVLANLSLRAWHIRLPPRSALVPDVADDDDHTSDRTPRATRRPASSSWDARRGTAPR